MMRKELVQAEDTLAIEIGVQKFIEWIRSGKLQIDELVYAFYELTPEENKLVEDGKGPRRSLWFAPSAGYNERYRRTP